MKKKILIKCTMQLKSNNNRWTPVSTGPCSQTMPAAPSPSVWPWWRCWLVWRCKEGGCRGGGAGPCTTTGTVQACCVCTSSLAGWECCLRPQSRCGATAWRWAMPACVLTRQVTTWCENYEGQTRLLNLIISERVPKRQTKFVFEVLQAIWRQCQKRIDNTDTPGLVRIKTPNICFQIMNKICSVYLRSATNTSEIHNSELPCKPVSLFLITFFLE